MTHADAVRERAIELLAIACGSAEVELGRFRPPRASAAVKVDASGRKQHFISVATEVRMRAQIQGRVERKRPDGRVEVVDVSPPAPRPAEWLKLALADPNMADVLAILGRENIRWHDLFHIYEIVEDDAAERIYTDSWATKAAVERFTHTANSRRAIGREARHGHNRFLPPTQPLPLAEARALIVGIVRRWLHDKSPPPPVDEVIVEVRRPEQPR